MLRIKAPPPLGILDRRALSAKVSGSRLELHLCALRSGALVQPLTVSVPGSSGSHRHLLARGDMPTLGHCRCRARLRISATLPMRQPHASFNRRTNRCGRTRMMRCVTHALGDRAPIRWGRCGGLGQADVAHYQAPATRTGFDLVGNGPVWWVADSDGPREFARSWPNVGSTMDADGRIRSSPRRTPHLA